MSASDFTRYGGLMIQTQGSWLRDQNGRTVFFRGVNLSGSSKVPTRPNGATHLQTGFYEHRDVSFVGRPFPLEQADEHFARLRTWGFNLLRFLITWEAVEHSGPGLYDDEYLDYARKILEKAGEYDFSVIIDPHQDVWSRFSGGDGAPGWTLEAVGFNLKNMHETGAAFVHQVHGDPFPHMIWPTNGARLAAATMFTLFFGGNDFAPHTKVNGEPVQEYLQRHYIAAFQHVASRLKDLPHIIGYEVFNEPLSGFIGMRDLTRPFSPIKFGPTLSPIQTILLGDGIPQEIEIWERTLLGSRLVERRWMNPKRLRIWREGYPGVWRQKWVWDLDAKGYPKLLRPDHFWKSNGREVDFSQDYIRPLINRFASAIREEDPDALIFIETDPRLPPPAWGPDDAANIVYAPHWYDATVLFLKTFSRWIGINVHNRKIVFGARRVQQSFKEQIAQYKKYAEVYLRKSPTLIGEIGIAYDLNKRAAYRTGNFQMQVQAMDRTLRAAEENLLSYTIWNYTPDNNNQHGDQWNGEDLSIFSLDQMTNPSDPFSGGRALQAVIRPYPRAVAGYPLQLSFDIQRRIFTFAFRHNSKVHAPTVIFTPKLQYPEGYAVSVSDGECEIYEEEQILVYWHSSTQEAHQIQITPKTARNTTPPAAGRT